MIAMAQHSLCGFSFNKMSIVCPITIQRLQVEDKITPVVYLSPTSVLIHLNTTPSF